MGDMRSSKICGAVKRSNHHYGDVFLSNLNDGGALAQRVAFLARDRNMWGANLFDSSPCHSALVIA